MSWQEVNRNKWSKAFLTDLFTTASITLEGTEDAKMSFFRADVTGDCSLAMKNEGALPRPMFELKLELDWKVEQKVDSGKSIVEAKGQVEVTEFSSEDISSPQMRLVCDNQLPPGAGAGFKDLIDKLNEAVRKHGLPEISRMLADEFIAALKKQV
mmetsp:Transcript_129257/g.258106  ORF Transcript_129257/g.258106 Transcript_129257/m.258106 type:complete len:155 (-) Transcript_129257:46-510(-)